jgi:hypothetical protein
VCDSGRDGIYVQGVNDVAFDYRPEVFDYTITDRDGDAASAQLTIDLSQVRAPEQPDTEPDMGGITVRGFSGVDPGWKLGDSLEDIRNGLEAAQDMKTTWERGHGLGLGDENSPGDSALGGTRIGNAEGLFFTLPEDSLKPTVTIQGNGYVTVYCYDADGNQVDYQMNLTHGHVDGTEQFQYQGDTPIHNILVVCHSGSVWVQGINDVAFDSGGDVSGYAFTDNVLPDDIGGNVFLFGIDDNDYPKGEEGSVRFYGGGDDAPAHRANDIVDGENIIDFLSADGGTVDGLLNSADGLEDAEPLVGSEEVRSLSDVEAVKNGLAEAGVEFGDGTVIGLAVPGEWKGAYAADDLAVAAQEDSLTQDAVNKLNNQG